MHSLERVDRVAALPVVELDRFDARVNRGGEQSEAAEGSDLGGAGADVDLVTAALQLEHHSGTGEDVPGGGRGVGEQAGHHDAPLVAVTDSITSRATRQ